MSLSAMSVDSLVRMAQIVWFDLLLSGDNAVVIALACRNLPESKRRIASGFGAASAIVLRLAFAIVIFQFLRLPGLDICGGALLMWIAVALIDQTEEATTIAPATSFWGAVRLIAVADALMSLDNVLAINAASHGDGLLMAFGLMVSLPLVVYGAGIFLRVLKRAPWLVWASASLIGWSAGQLVVEDSALAAYVFRSKSETSLLAGAAGAVIVVCAGVILRWLDQRRPRAPL